MIWHGSGLIIAASLVRHQHQYIETCGVGRNRQTGNFIPIKVSGPLTPTIYFPTLTVRSHAR